MEEGFKDWMWKIQILLNGDSAQFGELRQVLAPDALLQSQVPELAGAAGFDQASVRQLPDVVRAGGGGDAETAAGIAATQLWIGGDPLQHAVALAVRDGLADAAELARGHRSNNVPDCSGLTRGFTLQLPVLDS